MVGWIMEGMRLESASLHRRLQREEAEGRPGPPGRSWRLCAGATFVVWSPLACLAARVVGAGCDIFNGWFASVGVPPKSNWLGCSWCMPDTVERYSRWVGGRKLHHAHRTTTRPCRSVGAWSVGTTPEPDFMPQWQQQGQH